MITYNQKNQNVQLHFVKNCFFIGEFLQGNIEVNLESGTVISGVLIEIYYSEFWSVKSGSDNKEPVTMNNSKSIVKYNLDLKQLKKFQFIENDLILPSGVSFIPFNFRFSEENNPSFEYPYPKKKAYARYNFSVKLMSPYLTGNTSSYILMISRPIIESEKLLLKSINQHIKKWKVFDKGNTILEISIPENNYKYNSNCTVKVLIDNKKGKASTKEYKVVLRRKIKFKDKIGGIKYTNETEIVSDIIKAVVAPGNSQSFEYILSFKEKNTEKKYNYSNETNPYNAAMDKIDYFMPTFHGEIISCDYEIKVSVFYDCFVAYTDRPRLILPVFIVHQLPMDYQLEIQEQIEYENALKKSIIDTKKKYNDNDSYNNNHHSKEYNDNNNFIIQDKKERDNSLGNNYIENKEDEDNNLPSLDAIEEANKNKLKENYDNNIINVDNNSNYINNNDDFNFRRKTSDNNEDNCPPCVFESAPVPFQNKNETNKYQTNSDYNLYNSEKINTINTIENNNSYPTYNNNNFNRNENENRINIKDNYSVPKGFTDDYHNENENRINSNDNYSVPKGFTDGYHNENLNNISDDNQKDFSLFNTENTNEGANNIYKNINEI